MVPHEKSLVYNNGQAECFLSAAHSAALKFLFILHPQPSALPKRRDVGTPIRIHVLYFFFFFFFSLFLHKRPCKPRAK
jgi:hypothetical protein